MSYIPKISIVMSMVLMLTSCNWLFRSPELQTIKILDVNEPLFYNDLHIKGALNISYKQVPELVKNWDKDIPIIVYCSTYQCTESTRVAEKLHQLSFTNVKVYKGGTQEWYQLHQNNPDKYPIEGPGEQKYLKRSIEKDSATTYSYPTVKAQELNKLIQKHATQV